MERPLEKFNSLMFLRLVKIDEERDLLDEIENEKHKQDLRSVLNKKAYSRFELDEVMMCYEAEA
ncbi:hypothetical protein JXB31_04900 [Candidatus Woesearchaeota archaeon]|nr:hypothetical protein [Candidatus Woesearchaeota archaeon]